MSSLNKKQARKNWPEDRRFMSGTMDLSHSIKDETYISLSSLQHSLPPSIARLIFFPPAHKYALKVDYTKPGINFSGHHTPSLQHISAFHWLIRLSKAQPRDEKAPFWPIYYTRVFAFCTQKPGQQITITKYLLLPGSRFGQLPTTKLISGFLI